MANFGTDRLSLQNTTGAIQSNSGDPILSTDDSGSSSYALGGILSAGIYSGVQNGNFASPPPSIGTATPLSDDNPLPYFSVVDGSSGRITAAVVADTLQASGYSVRFTIIDGQVGDQLYLERIVAMPSSRAQAASYQPRSSWTSASSATTFSAFTDAIYVQADGTTTVGTSGSAARTGAFIAAYTSTALEIQSNPNVTSAVTTDGAFLRVRAGVKVNSTPTGTAIVDLVEIRLDSGRTQTILTDSELATSYGYGAMYLSSGDLRIRPNETGLSGANPNILLRSSVGDVVIDGSRLGSNGSAVSGGNIYLAHNQTVGKVYFGGSAGATYSDTNLYRSASDTLKTDDSLVVTGSLTVGGTIIYGVPPGVVQSYLGGTSTLPTGWILANGASLSTATYPALFAVIGYNFGGSGASFNVPNMNVGYFLVGSTSTPATGFMTGSADSYLNTTWNHTHSTNPAAFNSAATTTAVVTASGSGAGPAALSHTHSIDVPATTSSDAGPADAYRMRVVYIIKT